MTPKAPTEPDTRIPEGSPPKTDEGGGGGGWVHLTSAPDHVTGDLLAGMLAEEGIETIIDDFNPSPGAWLKPFGDPLAPVKILVKKMDLERASLILHEVDHAPTDEDAIHPETRRMWWMAMLAVMAVAVLTFLEIVDFAPCVLRLFCI